MLQAILPVVVADEDEEVVVVADEDEEVEHHSLPVDLSLFLVLAVIAETVLWSDRMPQVSMRVAILLPHGA